MLITNTEAPNMIRQSDVSIIANIKKKIKKIFIFFSIKILSRDFAWIETEADNPTVLFGGGGPQIYWCTHA